MLVRAVVRSASERLAPERKSMKLHMKKVLKKGPEGNAFRALCNANLLASTI